MDKYLDEQIELLYNNLDTSIMDYFDLDEKMIANYQTAIAMKAPYDSNSDLATWHKKTREQLKYLVEKELSKALGRDLIAVYSQRPYKQAGRGKGLWYLDYILIGFVPDDTNYNEERVFIKLEFSLFKTPCVFKIEIDTDHSKTKTRVDNHQTKDYPIDKSFPTDWAGLVELIKDECALKCKQWEEIMNNKTPNPKAQDQPEETGTACDGFPLNLILYGPPGTGKTYKMQTEYLPKFEEGNRFVTTFHQSFGYEEFVEGLKPVLSNPNDTNNDIKYKVVDGIFKEACEKAAQKAGYDSLSECIEDTFESRSTKFADAKPVLLCIDEINRGNVAAIFGDLISLIEDSKRLGAKKETEMIVSLPYSQKKFGVPANLYILGTMNTADRSVEALDTALRRRFSFKEIMPQPELCKGMVCNYELSDILTTVNNRIRALKDREHQIGHSYFMECPNEGENKKREWLKKVFKDQIIPLLQEYFYGNYAFIGLVMGNGFVKEDTEANNPSFANFDDDNDFEPKTSYRLLTEKDWMNLDLGDALGKLMNR